MTSTRVMSAKRTRASTGSRLSGGTLAAAAIAVCVAQVALAIPAVLNGLFQQDLGTTSSQLTWISDAFLVPVTLLELTFGVLGDLFGRKRLLIGGATCIALGELVAVLTPGASSSTDTRVLVLWSGQILAGIGAAAIFPTTLAMVAAGTHTVAERSRALTIWAAALASGGFISPVLGGLVTKAHFGSDEYASWRWAFIAVLGLALVSAIVSALLSQDSSAPEGRSLDWPGQATVAIAMFALLYAVIQGPTSGWGSGEVVAGFVIGGVALALFVLVEHRSDAPLLRMDLFHNRAFAIASLVTVVGMFAYLGAAYTTSIRLAAIQGFSPLRTSIAFVFLNGMCLPLMPVTKRLLERYNPKWALGAGSLLTAIGTFWLATISASDRSLLSITAPLIVIGVGFAFGVASVTAVAVNTVPNQLAGMASGATSMLRDFGFTLGPAVIGAIALSRAASDMQARIASSQTLQKALAAFNGAAAHVPPAQRPEVAGAIGAVNSGPLGANAVPAMVPGPDGKLVPFNPLKNVAFHALDNAYSIGYVVCGCAALLAAILAVLFIGGDSHETLITVESLED